MDYQQAQFYFNIATTIFVSLVSVQTYFVKKHAATISSITRVENNVHEKIVDQEKIFRHTDETIKTKLDSLGNRLTNLEAIMSKTPTHGDLGQMYERMNAMDGNIKSLAGEFKQVSQSLDRLYQVILEHGRV